MKVFLSVLVFAMSLPAAAQTADAIYRRACGPKDASFDVQLVKGQPPAAPEPGKALVYFIQTGNFFTTRVGLDGTWAGVNQHDSFTFASVAPGEHHACAATLNRKHLQAVLVHFTAEAGKTYFYLLRGVVQGGYDGAGAAFMEFEPADSDESLALIASYPQSTATPKP